jgi:hypothetical protein
VINVWRGDLMETPAVVAALDAHLPAAVDPEPGY